MTCQCCATDLQPDPPATAHADCDCGCGPDCGCGCGPTPRAETQRHLEEIRRRISALEPAGA